MQIFPLRDCASSQQLKVRSKRVDLNSHWLWKLKTCLHIFSRVRTTLPARRDKPASLHLGDSEESLFCALLCFASRWNHAHFA